MRCHLLALALIALLAACGGKSASDATTAGAPAQARAEAAAATAPNDAKALQPGQSVQGMIEADIGNGMQAFRSLSTKVADDIGQQVDAGLASGKGERPLAEANRRLAQSGAPARVDAEDVRDLVGSMAGKTFHDSAIRHIRIIDSLAASLNGTAGDGARLSIELRFDESTETLQEASLSYQPAGQSAINTYQTTKQEPVQVTIEQFAKNADGSYALIGSFRAENVPPGSLSKQLAGTTLASIHGRFAFESLPAKELRIGGGG